MHRLLILEPEHKRWKMGGIRRMGDRKGEEVEHSRGATSVGVE